MTIAHNPQQLADGDDRQSDVASLPQTLAPHIVQHAHDAAILASLNVLIDRSKTLAQLIYFPSFALCWYSDEGTETVYPDGTRCLCPVVPDDSIHAAQLSAHLNAVYTPARHRLEHELWHHLVGIYVYGDQSSPIIWREAHGIAHPPSLYWTGEYIDRMPAHEEWLVAALSHHMHGDPSYDYGARRYLAHERGIDVDKLLAIGRELLAPSPEFAKV